MQTLDSTSICNVTANHKYLNLVRSAKKRNKEIRLTERHAQKLLDVNFNNGVCDYTGAPFSPDTRSPFYPTIDRINPKLGYIPGNVVVCTAIANSLKQSVFENAVPWKRTKRNDSIVNSIFVTLSTNICFKAKKYLMKGEHVNLVLNLNTLLQNHNTVVTEILKDTNSTESNSDILTSVPNAYSKNGLVKKLYSTKKVNKCTMKDFNEFCSKNSNVVLTFYEFYTVFNSEKCKFSGEYIKNPVVIVIDKARKVCKNNITVIDAKYQEAYK